MYYKNTLFIIILGMLSACAESEEFTFGQFDDRAKEIEVIPLSSFKTMVSYTPEIATYFTADTVEAGRYFQFNEKNFLDLSSWVRVWKDSNGKLWEIREEFEASTSYSLLIMEQLNTEADNEITLFRYTGLTFTTPEEDTCPYINEVECELVDFRRLDNNDGKEVYTTVVKINLPQKISLPNGDYLMPNNLLMETHNHITGHIIQSYQKYNYYDYWEDDGNAYISFQALDNAKYDFVLSGELTLMSDNESFGEIAGFFRINIKNTLDLTNAK